MMETRQECPLSSLLRSTEPYVPVSADRQEGEMRNTAGKEELAFSLTGTVIMCRNSLEDFTKNTNRTSKGIEHNLCILGQHIKISRVSI